MPVFQLDAILVAHAPPDGRKDLNATALTLGHAEKEYPSVDPPRTESHQASSDEAERGYEHPMPSHLYSNG